MSRGRTEPGGSVVVDAEADLDFIAGFPCNKFGCDGTLRKSYASDRLAVVCSYCGDVVYVLEGG